MGARHKSGRSARVLHFWANLSVLYTCGSCPVVGQTPWSAGDPPVAHPALDHRYSRASLTRRGWKSQEEKADQGVGCGPGGPPH
ncbi:hypothetical protein SBA4_1380026 [Candidatus Sulfopaludibacter sp. SbA4]|nr:hypothetical protein SBA4_1380026 [Candidatus Sulfopaludibacter sp. SbA4]